MTTRARPRRLAALLLCLLLLSACEPSGASPAASIPNVVPARPNFLRIYSSLPMKGHALAEADQIREAIDLALELQGNRVGAWQIEHIALDSGTTESGEWSPEVERANAEAAALDPAAVAYIGPYTSGATGVSLPVTNQAHILQLGVSATWPGLTVPGWNTGEPDTYYPAGLRNYARLSVPDSRQATAAVQWAEREGIKSAIAVDDGSSYSAGLAAEFARAAKTHSIQVAGSIHLHTRTPAELSESLSLGSADGLFYAPSTPELAARFAAAFTSRGSTIKVFSTDTALSDLFPQSAGGGADYWYFMSNTGSPPPDSPQWADFRGRFQSKYGKTPPRVAANAFDLANLVLSAAGKSGRDRDAVRAAVLHAQGVRGVTGLISFDSAGDTLGWSIDGYRLRSGRFVLEGIFKGTGSH